MPRGPWPVVGVRSGGDGSGVACPADLLPSLGKLHLASTFFPCGIAAVCSLLDFEHLRSEPVSRPKPLASFLWVVFFFFVVKFIEFFFYKPSRLVFF